MTDTRAGVPAPTEERLQSDPYLSIVACSRNDGHGENLVERMQLFVDGIADQAARFRIDCELVLVDWNPPVGKPGLSDVLEYPSGNGYLTSRIVTVPPAIHDALPHSSALPLFQMIAKNVGIRRARGRMVLSTNIDILFPDTLMARVARRDLDEGFVYRTDRADVKVPFGAGAARDLTAMRALPPMRVHRRNGTYDGDGHRIVPLYTGPFDLLWYQATQALWRDRPRQVRPANPDSRATVGPPQRSPSAAAKLWGLAMIPKPHVNGCGDFTMMSAASWSMVGGHVEWPAYSWNLDTLLMYQAIAYGVPERAFDRRCAVLHMDHSRGSGWTPEGAGDLFDRMAARGIRVYTNADLVRDIKSLGVARLSRPSPRRFNPPSWGYANSEFTEVRYARVSTAT